MQSRRWPRSPRPTGHRRRRSPSTADGDGTINAEMAMPSNAGATLLVHFFSRGLADEKCKIKRFSAHADGNINPWPDDGQGARGEAGPFGRRAPVRALAWTVVTMPVTLHSAAVLRTGGDATAGDADGADAER